MDWVGDEPIGPDSGDGAVFFVRVLVWLRWGFIVAIALTLPGVVTTAATDLLNDRSTWTLAFYLGIALPVNAVALRAARHGDVSRASLLTSVLLWGPVSSSP